MPPHASPRAVRSRLRSGLTLLAAAALLAGCGGDSATGPTAETPAAMTLDVASAAPSQVVFARVRGVAVPSTPISGRVGTAPVTALRADDSTLAFAIPAVASGSYDVRLLVGTMRFAATVAVTEPTLVARPADYVANTLASAALQVDLTMAELDSSAAGQNAALLSGMREALADARRQFDALTPAQQAEVAAVIAANAEALGIRADGAMQLVQSGSLSLADASLVEARCRDADGNTLSSYEECKASLGSFLSANRQRIRKIALLLIAIKVGAAAGGPVGIVAAGVSVAIVTPQIVGLAYESWQRFVVPQFDYFTSDEFFQLRAAAPFAADTGAAATTRMSAAATTPEFVSGVARPVTVRASYRSPVQGDAGADPVVAGAIGILNDITAIWNGVVQYLPFDASLPAIPTEPAQRVTAAVPTPYLALGAVTPSTVTGTATTVDGAWALRFASAGIGNDLPFGFVLRHVPPGAAERTTTIAATLRPAQYAVASVTVTPAQPLVMKGATLQLVAEARDSSNRVITGLRATWSSSNTTIARVDTLGVVTGVDTGTVFINGAVGGKTGIVMLKVWAPAAASVTIEPQSPVVMKGATLQLAATLKDSAGTVLAGTVAWSSANAARATVDGAGLVTGRDTGTVTITATAANGKSATVSLRVTPAGLAVATLASATTLGGSGSGGWHSCVFATDGALHCWGYNNAGMVGDGTTQDRLQPTLLPNTVGLRTVATGMWNSCGLTSAGKAYCWGIGAGVGDGTTTDRYTPVAVAGDLTFASLNVGYANSCGITTSGQAYCWGRNVQGELGTGDTLHRAVPTPVSGGYSFASIWNSGNSTTCGITASGQAYCWGAGGDGRLGDGSTAQRNYPGPVSGGISFRKIVGGNYHMCGLSTGGRTYCWGANYFRQLGDADTQLASFTPRLVTTAPDFVDIGSGLSFNCGLTADGQIYCWGSALVGRLGNGQSDGYFLPAPIATTARFTSMSIGGDGGCGLTAEGKLYCWGSNSLGSIGDGTTTDRLTPVLVNP